MKFLKTAYSIFPPNSLLLLIPISIFLWLKAANNTIYFSDTNVYFATAQALLHGKILYKDIFFTNLPLFPYISAFYILILKGNLVAYGFTGIIEAVFASLLVYYITYKKTNSTYAFISCILFLFSSNTLTNATGQVGMFSAIIFVLLAYIFLEKKKFKLTGFFLACCLLTKAYFFPIVLPFFIIVGLSKNSKNLKTLLLTFAITCLLIILPSLLLAGKEMWFDLVQYSLNKQGIFDKFAILSNFFITDFVLAAAAAYSLTRFRKDPFFTLTTVFFLLFFTFNTSMYSLYLNMIVPFLCIYASSIFIFIEKNFKVEMMVIPTFLLFYVVALFMIYANSDLNLNKINNFDQIIRDVKKTNPNYIYGTTFVTTAITSYTNIPLMNNITDTDDSLFGAGVLNAQVLTNDAIKKKADVLVWGAQYVSNNEIKKDVLNVAVDKKLLYEKCKLVNTYPFHGPYYINLLFLYKC